MAMADDTGGVTTLARIEPAVRRVTVDDVSAALAAGLRDFQTAPVLGLFFGGVYAAGGLAILMFATWFDFTFAVYPLAAGFALIGPFVAVGLYEVSRRIEAGEPLTFADVLGAVAARGGQEIGWMALVSVFALIIWIYSAGWTYAIFFGLTPLDFNELVQSVFTTARGAAFFVVGTALGAAIVLVVFAVTAVSFPLLLDRDVDFVTAMITSVKAVTASPGPMLGWGIFVAFMLLVAIVPLFLGLVVVLPVLGHATWHLYRKAVVKLG